MPKLGFLTRLAMFSLVLFCFRLVLFCHVLFYNVTVEILSLVCVYMYSQLTLTLVPNLN